MAQARDLKKLEADLKGRDPVKVTSSLKEQPKIKDSCEARFHYQKQTKTKSLEC